MIDNAKTIEDQIGEKDSDYSFYPFPRHDGKQNRWEVRR